MWTQWAALSKVNPSGCSSFSNFCKGISDFDDVTMIVGCREGHFRLFDLVGQTFSDPPVTLGGSVDAITCFDGLIQAPTAAPTNPPTDAPTDAPTGATTDAPTDAPTAVPTVLQTAVPTEALAPTLAPTVVAPTLVPTVRSFVKCHARLFQTILCTGRSKRGHAFSNLATWWKSTPQ